MTRPRLGFLGVGWIGRHRMAAILATGAIDAVAICDVSPECAGEAAALAPTAIVVRSVEEMLTLGVDGVVIATPSAQHAEQAITALRGGASVFCQKPLGRSGAETAAVVAAARIADRLLGVDLSYRHIHGMQRINELVRSGALGRIFAVDLIFHNAYGPDKPWFYDRAMSGGGCVIDLGVHLIDLAMWLFDFPAVSAVSSALFSGGEPLPSGAEDIEDYASANFRLGTATDVRLACSWRLNAGRSAVIEASFYGTRGGASLRNVEGSFYDFCAEQFSGTGRELLTDLSDAWGGRAAAAWAVQLALDPCFDSDAEGLVRVAEVIDAVYAR